MEDDAEVWAAWGKFTPSSVTVSTLITRVSVRAQGGWSKKSPVFWEYADGGECWEDNATDGIGL